jgi:transformation/transcription domain-associated protein
MPHIDALKDHAAKVIDVVLELVRTDNEENALICVKVLVDMSRSFKETEERHVTTFIEIFKDLYTNMEGLVQETFSEKEHSLNDLSAGLRSFKVLAECPIATVLLFQQHRATVNPAIRAILPIVVSVRLDHPFTGSA